MKQSGSQTTHSRPLQLHAASDKTRGTKPAARFAVAAAVVLLLCGLFCGTAGADGESCTITLDMQGGTDGTGSVNATYNEMLPTIIPPKKTGFTFQGYFARENGVGTKYYDANGTGTKIWNLHHNVTVYAYWTEIKHTVTFYSEPETPAVPPDPAVPAVLFKTEQVTHGHTVSKPLPAPVKEGFSFSGWHEGSPEGPLYVFSTPVTSNIALYAGWTETNFTISFDGVPTGVPTGAWVYADSTVTIPVVVSGAEKGISAFSITLDIYHPVVEDTALYPTYQTTNGSYVAGTDPHYGYSDPVTWAFAYNEGHSTATSPEYPDMMLTRYILTASGISIYGGPFGSDPYQIGTITLPLSNRDDLAYVILQARTTEAYDEAGDPILGDSGQIPIGVRPYPEHITYYGDYYNTVLDPVTALVEDKYYGNITACVYTGEEEEFEITRNLFDAKLGDIIAWTLVPAGSAKDTATLSKNPVDAVSENSINPTPISGRAVTGTAYLNAVVTFSIPTIGTDTATGEAYVVYNTDKSEFHETWTGKDSMKHKFQTGAEIEHVYILEIPADFSLKPKVSVTRSVHVSDFVIPNGEQLNVYLSSDQFDSEGNTYRLYLVKDKSLQVGYSIEANGEPVEESPKLILKATEEDMKKIDGVTTQLDFRLKEEPLEMGAYRDKLTFRVDFTGV